MIYKLPEKKYTIVGYLYDQFSKLAREIKAEVESKVISDFIECTVIGTPDKLYDFNIKWERFLLSQEEVYVSRNKVHAHLHSNTVKYHENRVNVK